MALRAQGHQHSEDVEGLDMSKSSAEVAVSSEEGRLHVKRDGYPTLVVSYKDLTPNKLRGKDKRDDGFIIEIELDENGVGIS